MATVISKPKEKPRLKITWWAMALGLLSLLSLPLFLIISLIVCPDVVAKTMDYGMWFGYVSSALAVAGIVTSIIALVKGERSWALWVGLISAALVAALGVLVFIGNVGY